MAAPAPITAVATAKAAVAAWPSNTPLTWNKGIDRAPSAISPVPSRICERINPRSSSACFRVALVMKFDEVAISVPPRPAGRCFVAHPSRA
jgi:hypothetical protein